MKKTLKEKKITVLVVGIFLVVVVIVGGAILLFSPDQEENPNTPAPTEPNSDEISVDQAEQIYEDLTKDCTGALTWNLSIGDKVPIENLEDYTTACKTENYYSKMIGYTYDASGNIILHVNVLKRTDNNVYNLEDELIGTYDDTTINTLLDLGTTYAYTYQNNGENYQLIAVEWVK